MGEKDQWSQTACVGRHLGVDLGRVRYGRRRRRSGRLDALAHRLFFYRGPTPAQAVGRWRIRRRSVESLGGCVEENP